VILYENQVPGQKPSITPLVDSAAALAESRAQSAPY